MNIKEMGPRTDLHVAPGQADGLSYNPEHPVDEQVEQDARTFKLTEVAPEQIERLKKEAQYFKNMFGPGTDEEARATKMLEELEALGQGAPNSSPNRNPKPFDDDDEWHSMSY
jgi:hypothetical protein